MTERERFIDAMGDLLASWHLARATGRLYGYLLLQEKASTSERLRADLGMSAGAVSTSTRELVSWGLARTISQRGSRRLMIEAAGGFEQLLRASHERTRLFIRTLQDARSLTDGEEAARRLQDVVELFTAYVETGEQMLEHRASR